MKLESLSPNSLKKFWGTILRSAGANPNRLGAWKEKKAVVQRLLTGPDARTIATQILAWANGREGADALEPTTLVEAVSQGFRVWGIDYADAAPAGGPAPAEVPEPAPAAEGSLDRVIERIAARAATRVLEQEKHRLLDAEQVARIARAAVSGLEPIKVERPDGTTVDAGRQHRRFKDLLRWLAVGYPVLLYGPAGGGKTTAARKAAESLGLRPLVLHLGPQTTQSSLFGYFDANGRYVPSPLRKAYEGLDEYADGAVVVLDELDRCNPRVSVTLNGGIENGHMTFPDGEVKRSPKTFFVACANTVLHGADRTYVSAQQQDGAFRDRFVFLDWGYDEDFELDLAVAYAGGDQGLEQKIREWVAYVQKARKAAEDLRSRIVVSPRASLMGAKAIAAGIDRQAVEAAVLWKGAEVEEVQKIKNAAMA